MISKVTQRHARANISQARHQKRFAMLCRGGITCFAGGSLFYALFHLFSFSLNFRGTDNLGAAAETAHVQETQTMIHPFLHSRKIIYGTAWKEEQTADLVYQALSVGFRAIDTACQPKHYQEDLVGQGIEKAMEDLGISRDEIFIQTKFTSVNGQDPNRMPYDKSLPIDEQVLASFQVSKRNLGKVDSLVLHSPMPTMKQTLRVWETFEEIHDRGDVQFLGISNIYDLNSLKEIYETSRIKPSFVQNRFYDKTGYDRDLRAFCIENNIRYQSFWSLTANPSLVNSDLVKRYAKQKEATKEQIWFAFLQHSDIIPLSGTKNTQHMKEDLKAADIVLSDAELQSLKALLKP